MQNMAENPTVDTKGAAWLSEQIEAKLKQTVEPAKVRIILRKLVADGTIERGDGRWSFTGLKDPAVVAVFAAVKEQATAGDAPAAKRPAAKKAAAPAKKAAPAKRTSRKKAAPEPEPEEDVLDDDELDLD
ncbi:hypothetical protein SEA_YAKULT_37 [Gordonia phage Yakult]|nr:hypothetical protein SEA_YAKULT_37 [Gordonia phage Yakult]